MKKLILKRVSRRQQKHEKLPIMQRVADLVILHAFLLSAHFFKINFSNIILVSNSLDPDQAEWFVRPDLGPNCLQRLSYQQRTKSPQARKELRAGYSINSPIIARKVTLEEILIVIGKPRMLHKSLLSHIVNVRLVASHIVRLHT